MCHINELSIHGFRLKDHKACDTQSNYRDLKKVHLNPITSIQ